MEQNEYTVGHSNLNLPHDVIELPSRGLYYKSKKKSVKIGYLTATDENILSNFDVTQTLTESIILPVLRNKLYERDIRPEELLDGDVEAILIFLRNTAFGPEYKVSTIDPITNKSFIATVSLEELDYKKTEHQPDENGIFNVKLPVSKSNVGLKILNLSERIEIDKILKSYPSERTPPTITTKLQKQIHSINGDTDPIKITTFISSMPIADSKFIRKFLFENEPRLNLSKEVIAPSGEKVMVDISFGVEFFRPFVQL